MFQSEVLTCVYISEGFPLPAIKWLILNIHTGYLVTTTVFNHTVNSTVSLPSKTKQNMATALLNVSVTMYKGKQEKIYSSVKVSLKNMVWATVLIPAFNYLLAHFL